MKVAAIYDIHGNLPALKAVLDDIQKEGVDWMLVGGDVVPGPMPVQTLDCLLSLDIPTVFVRGNGDREVVASYNGKENLSLPEQALEAIRWTAAQLTPDYIMIMEEWQEKYTCYVPGMGEILFCHATPQNDTDIFTKRTPVEKLLPIFEGNHSPMIVCGHTHMQFDREIGTKRVVNAGSVGMPFGEPGAYWLLIENDFQLRKTDYDVEETARIISATRYPDAVNFAANFILLPPSEETMLEVFDRRALK